MENSDAIALRRVRCPRCQCVLEELRAGVYRCGGCASRLRAKILTGSTNPSRSELRPQSIHQSIHLCQDSIDQLSTDGPELQADTAPVFKDLEESSAPVYLGQANVSSLSRSGVPGQRRHIFQPIPNGAPFIVCSSCFKLLHVPIDFAPSNNTVGKLQCGSCSSVLSFSYRDPARKKPYQESIDQLSSYGSELTPDEALEFNDFIGEATCCESYSEIGSYYGTPVTPEEGVFRLMKIPDAVAVHRVRCPRCQCVLEEPSARVYRCGGCGSNLRAKIRTGSAEEVVNASSGSRSGLPRQSRHNCRPILNGAPFIVCSSCFKLLHVPIDFAVSNNTVGKLQCGSCSSLLSYSYRDPARKKPYYQDSVDQPNTYISELKLGAALYFINFIGGPESYSKKGKGSYYGTPITPHEVEEPHYTPYKDALAWFAMGKRRQKGLGYTFMQQAGHKLLGRDEIRKNIMENILLDRNDGSNCTVICIYGGSGFGKTSLLSVLYNDQELLDSFDKRIWIQMSDKLDVVMFFRKIIEFFMNDHCIIMNTELLQELLMEEITDEKFLLILDDADIEDQHFWNSILEVLNAGAKGSVVIMATKSCIVPTLKDATYVHFLNPLSEGDKLMLFQQYSGVETDIQNNPDLVMVAKRFISRFGSNPLNLKAIGGLLCHADTISLTKDNFEGSDMPLQLCHDVLPLHLKKCLAFCSLFPEGYIFDKHHTVCQWISHVHVRTLEGYGLEDVGLEYFNELLCRSFFRPSPIHNDQDDKFVMHELMYKVVESVGHDRYFKSEDPMSSVPENTLHLSLVPSQFQTVKLMSITEELKDLQTFLVVQSEWKAYKVSTPTLSLVGLDDFFQKFTTIETLDLSHTDIQELPGSIVGLKKLQYLSIDGTSIRDLPSEVCSLSNLQTLKAKDCRRLTELPRNTKKLVKLRHLDVSKQLGYVHLPHGIGLLTELQTLAVFHVSGELSHCSISELGSLQHLRGCLWLSGLESVKTSSKAQEANLKDKQHLRDLTLQWYDDGLNIEDEDQDEDAKNVADEQVLESLQPHANLQVLTIRGYEGTTFPAWMQDSSSVPNLVTLTLDSCCNCTQFPAIAQLPSLKSLSVRKMYDVQRLSSNTVHGAAKFPSLELLNLWEMYGLEELFEESEGDCPRLRKVCVSRCPDLKRLPCAPSLTELVLHCCHQLPDISGLASLVSLKIEGFHGIKSLSLPAGAALKKLEIRSCKELLSVHGLSALTTVQRLKIAGCPKLVLPGTSYYS